MAKPPPRAVVRAVTGLARFLYRASGGRIGGSIKGAPVLLLTTAGRQTGKPRTSPLLYLRDGEALVVVASFAGSDRHPAWFLNLEANPGVRVRIGKEPEKAMRARRATPQEKERLWPRVIEAYDGYAAYQQKTARQIPLVILE